MIVYISTRSILVSLFIQLQQILQLKTFQLSGDNVNISYDGFIKMDVFTDCKLTFLGSTSKMDKMKMSLLIYV